jgi:hypothetical protein
VHEFDGGAALQALAVPKVSAFRQVYGFDHGTAARPVDCDHYLIAAYVDDADLPTE